MKAIKVILAMAVFMLFSGMAAAETEAPEAMLSNIANEVLDIIKNDKDIQSGNQAKFSAMLEGKVLPHFDLDHMSRIMLGKYWEESSKEQREAFVKEFIAFTTRIYASGLLDYHKQTIIKCEPPRTHAGNSDVSVKMLILQPGEEPGQADFSLGKIGDEWKVYDIIIDGISLMTTYRGQFLPLARQSGMDALIQKLAERNKQPVPSLAATNKK